MRRAASAPPIPIAVRHLLPNAMAPLIVAITLAIPTAIFAEAGLSFLGIGINEPTPSLGKMVADSAPYIRRLLVPRILPDAGHRAGDAWFHLRRRWSAGRDGSAPELAAMRRSARDVAGGADDVPIERRFYVSEKQIDRRPMDSG